MTPPLSLTNIYDLYKLLIFDIDGTIANRASGELLPGRRDFFRRLTVIDAPSSDHLQIALASNQGGVGFRYWLETTRPQWFAEKSPEEQAEQINTYPTQNQALTRVYEVVRQINDLYPHDPQTHAYVSFAWQFKSNGLWAPKPPGAENDIGWSNEWRKPAPGMLDQAMNDSIIAEWATLMIGDRDEDKKAARAAGCAFMWAKDFFEEVSE